MITYGSVCSGYDAASLAWRPLGWRCVFLSEIEPAPRAVLAHRWGAHDARLAAKPADAPLLWGDFTALRVRHLKGRGVSMPDILVGGTPCQAFSVAGKRQSLADARGNLSLSFVALAHAIDAQRQAEGRPGLVVVWENVPGCLNTKDNAFGCLLAGFVGADAPLHSPLERGRWPDSGLASGPRAWAAWRILDAQHFGLAQRRRRVLLVVGFRDALDPGAVLFERRGLRGHPAPRRKAREGFTDHAGAGAGRGDAIGSLYAPPLSFTLNAKGGSGRNDSESETLVAHTLRGEGFDASEDGTGKGIPLVPVAFMSTENHSSGDNVDIAPTLRAGGHAGSHANAGVPPAVAINLRGRDGGAAPELADLASVRAASGGASRSFALQGDESAESWAVRRLMPVECERLQGAPDDFTLVPYRGKPMADGPRYKMIGNSMAVPKMAWLGRRIAAALSLKSSPA